MPRGESALSFEIPGEPVYPPREMSSMASTEENPDRAESTADRLRAASPSRSESGQNGPGRVSTSIRLRIGVLLVVIAIPVAVSVVFERRAATEALRTTRLEDRLAALESKMRAVTRSLEEREADRRSESTAPPRTAEPGGPLRTAAPAKESKPGSDATAFPDPAQTTDSGATMAEAPSEAGPSRSGTYAIPSGDGLPKRGGPPIDPSEWAEFFAAKLLLGPLDADGREELRRLWNGHKAPTQRLVLDLLKSRFGIDWETFLVALQDPETGEEN